MGRLRTKSRGRKEAEGQHGDLMHGLAHQLLSIYFYPTENRDAATHILQVKFLQ